MTYPIVARSAPVQADNPAAAGGFTVRLEIKRARVAPTREVDTAAVYPHVGLRTEIVEIVIDQIHDAEGEAGRAAGLLHTRSDPWFRDAEDGGNPTHDRPAYDTWADRGGYGGVKGARPQDRGD